MQVLLHTDKNIDGGVRTAEYLETLTKDELHRFGEHITRVEAHLSDANSHAKANKDDIHCTLEARVNGLHPVVVKDHAGSAHQAIHGAMGKLKRAVETALDKQAPRRDATLADAIDTDAGTDTDETPGA